jgi:hypothetical protein
MPPVRFYNSASHRCRRQVTRRASCFLCLNAIESKHPDLCQMGEKENASLKRSSNPKKKRKPSLDNSLKKLHNLSILHMGQFHFDFWHMKKNLK